MSRKLRRVLDDIQKTEEKIAVWQDHLDALNTKREMLENAEIIKSVRSMRLGSRELLSVLEGVQNGTVTLSANREADAGSQADETLGSVNQAEPENDEAGDPNAENRMWGNKESEREDLRNETEN